MTNKRVDLDHLLSEASELSVWAGRPAVLEEVHRLQTRWDQLASGSVSRRENLEVELKVCMELLPTVVVVAVAVVVVIVVVGTVTVVVIVVVGTVTVVVVVAVAVATITTLIIMMIVVSTVVGLD